MNYSVYRFTLNMHTHRSQASVSAFYGDTAVRLLINLTDGGMPYLIGDGCTAVLSGTKADDKKLWDRCVIVDGTTIQYDFTEQTSNCPGVANCEITLYDAEGKIVTAPKFTIVIDEREVKDDDIPISETETALIDKIAIDETARVQAEAERASAEENRVQAETKRAEDFADFIKEVDDAEAVRANAETDRVNAEVARADAEAGRAEAETKRYDEFITLTSLAEGAETARAEAEEGRVQAEAKRAEEFTALKNAVEGAEAKRAEAEEGRVQAEIDRQQIVEELQNGFSTLSENGTVITGLHLDSDPKAYKYTFQVRGCKFNKTDGAISVGAEENIGSPVAIDLPLESVVVSGKYDPTNKQVVLTLKDGSTVAFSVIDLVSGLVSSDTFSYSIALINTSLNTHSASITALENKHSQHGTRISGAEANITNHGKRISEAENKLTDHGKRMSDAERKLAEHTTQLTNHDTRIVKAESKIEGIEEDLINVTEGKVDKIIDTNARIGSIMVVQSDGTQMSRQVDNMAVGGAIVMRDGASNFYIDAPIYNNHATNKKYVDNATAPIAENANKIADNTKRIENLENTLLTFGEDDSVAYIKNAPGGSAPNVMLNSVGGRSKKSKNLLPYMKTGIMIGGNGESKLIKPGEEGSLMTGLSATLSEDGTVTLKTSTPLTFYSRVDFLWDDKIITVGEGEDKTTLPKSGLQMHGTYTCSVEGSLGGYQISGLKFDSSATDNHYMSGVFAVSENSSKTISAEDYDCNNLRLVCIPLSKGAEITASFKVMLNEGDTALPFEINEGITESAVTDVTYAECGKNLFDKSQIFPETEGQIVQIPTGLRVDGYNRSTTLTPEQFLEMTGLKEGDTFTFSSNRKLVSGEWGAADTGNFVFYGKNGSPIFFFGGSINEGYVSVTRTIPTPFNNDTHKALIIFGWGVIDITEITITKGEVALPYNDTLSTFPIPTEMLQRPELADYGKEFTYIDFDRKVFVNAGHDITLDGSTDEHWNIDPSGYFICSSVAQYGHPAPDATGINVSTVCDRFRSATSAQNPPLETTYTTLPAGLLYFRTKVASTSAQWRAYLAANPIKVRYRVAEPVETDISQYLTGYDKYKMLKVGSGDIVFHNEKKNEVPSTITYVKAKE